MPAVPREPVHPKRSRLRRALRVAVTSLALLALLVIAAPYVIAHTGLRNAVLAAAFKDLNGSITARSATLSWFSPVVFQGIEIRPPIGPPIVTVASFAGDQPLWRMLLPGGDLGHFRCESPFARVVMAQGDSNFKRVFAADEPPQEADRAAPLEGVPRVNVSLSIVDGSLSLAQVQGDVFAAANDDPSRWNVQGINLAGGIRRSARDPRRALLYIEPGVLLDHARITPDVARAWLQYIAPILADSTETSGSFSIDLDQWQIPLDAPREATLGGRFAIHALDVTPGPIGRVIADLLQLPASVVASQESIVKFHMHDGRVHHKDLHFTLSGLPVTTHGSVGLDQSLELIADVTLPRFANEQAPVRGALSGRTLRIPIRGTLSKPEVDSQALARSGLDLLNNVLGNLAQTLESQRPGAEPLPAPDVGSPDAMAEPNWQATIQQALPLAEEILRNRIERRRQQQLQQSERNPQVPLVSPSEPMPPEFPQSQRPLRRRLRRLLDALGPPVESDAREPAASESPAPASPED